MQTWEQQVLQMLEEEYEAKDIMAEIDACNDDSQMIHLTHKLRARRDQAGWIKQKILDEIREKRRIKDFRVKTRHSTDPERIEYAFDEDSLKSISENPNKRDNFINRGRPLVKQDVNYER